MTIAVPSIIDLKNISRCFQSGDTVVYALNQVSLTITQGEFVALMGPSGSGKSTLMNIIGCLDRSDAGAYSLAGTDIATVHLAAVRSRMFGFIFQRYNLLATATAEENVELPAIYANTPASERRERAKELLAQLDLSSRAGHKPHQLSGGQQQKIAIARALINDPAIILADEPTGALDSQAGQEVMDLLQELHSQGRTIVLVTHDEKVAAHAERVVTMQDGRIVSDEMPTLTLREQTPQSLPQNMGSASFLATISESVKTARRSLRVNLFRTALTLLGIIIGVAAVIAMLAVGDGSKQKVLAEINQIGTHVLSVRPGNVKNSGYMGDFASMSTDDADEINSLPNVAAATPERASRVMVRFGSSNVATLIQGVGSSFTRVRDWPVARGSFFSERDLKSYATVAVVGLTVVKALFPNMRDPIGRYIIIHNIPFEIIGVMTSKGSSSMGGDQDDIVLIPITTGIIRLFGQNFLSDISVRVTDVKRMGDLQQTITALLMHRHGTEDFNIQNSTALLKIATATQGTLTTLLGVVAAISLLVGGIGVMNIMLVSVTERTREIGIRMATGARQQDILLQFNIEAALVCTIGGIIGVGVGLLAGKVIALFGIPVAFSLAPALVAFFCAFSTGLVFGYLPARKAAALNPISALAAD